MMGGEAWSSMSANSDEGRRGGGGSASSFCKGYMHIDGVVSHWTHCVLHPCSRHNTALDTSSCGHCLFRCCAWRTWCEPGPTSGAHKHTSRFETSLKLEASFENSRGVSRVWFRGPMSKVLWQHWTGQYNQRTENKHNHQCLKGVRHKGESTGWILLSGLDARTRRHGQKTTTLSNDVGSERVPRL